VRGEGDLKVPPRSMRRSQLRGRPTTALGTGATRRTSHQGPSLSKWMRSMGSSLTTCAR
jgi:hypothetical protein